MHNPGYVVRSLLNPFFVLEGWGDGGQPWPEGASTVQSGGRFK